MDVAYDGQDEVINRKENPMDEISIRIQNASDLDPNG